MFALIDTAANTELL